MLGVGRRPGISPNHRPTIKPDAEAEREIRDVGRIGYQLPRYGPDASPLPSRIRP